MDYLSHEKACFFHHVDMGKKGNILPNYRAKVNNMILNCPSSQQSCHCFLECTKECSLARGTLRI